MKAIVAHKADTGSASAPRHSPDPAILKELRQAFDGERYLRRYPHAARDVAGAFDHFYRHGWQEGRDPSDDFDTDFYRKRFQTLAASDMCPLEHFIRFGRKAGLPTTASEAAARRLAAWEGQEDRSIGLLHELDRRTARALIGLRFDEKHYLSIYPDVAAAGIDPLEHYLEHGWREGRVPSQGLDMVQYAKLHMGPREAAICPLLHYAVIGRMFALPASENESSLAGGHDVGAIDGGDIAALLRQFGVEQDIPHGEHIKRFIKPLFSASHYRRSHGLSEAFSDTEAFLRYLTRDLPAGESPGPLFSDEHYLAQARERGLRPPARDETPFIHWLKEGIDAGISPCPAFSADEYLHLNPDVRAYPGSPFEHFLDHGMQEGRRFSRLTDVRPGVLDEPSVQPAQAARRFCETLTLAAPYDAGLSQMRAFINSGRLAELVEHAAAMEPLVGHLEPSIHSMMPPWHDGRHHDYQRILAALPLRQADFVVLVPYGERDGASLVESRLAHELQARGSTLVIGTDGPERERPDWLPADANTVDLSPMLQPLHANHRRRLLYELIVHLRPQAVFNVASQAAFGTFAEYGERLALTTRLISYFSCPDRTEDGLEVGDSVRYFSTILDHSAAVITDNKALADQLIERFCLAGQVREKVRTIYTPPTSAIPDASIAEEQCVRSRQRLRKRILWAGRLDRQRRFGLVTEIARRMPDIDFDCWGEPAPDAGPVLSDLPANLHLYEPFGAYDDLPLADCDGWLYTAQWDGIPTLLVELGARGLPIAASAVGGIAELIDEKTGWPLGPAAASAEDYVEALRQMLGDPAGRVARARALQDRVRRVFSRERYTHRIGALLPAGSGETGHAAPIA